MASATSEGLLVPCYGNFGKPEKPDIRMAGSLDLQAQQKALLVPPDVVGGEDTLPVA